MKFNNKTLQIGNAPPALRPRNLLLAASLTCLGFAFACTGDQGPAGPQGPPGTDGGNPSELSPGDPGPGVNVTIVSVTGGSLAGGNFTVGNVPTVNYTLKQDDGTDWDVTDMGSSAIMFSGPTFNYQRVINRQNDLITNSVQQSDGSYNYTFPVPIPAVYEPPYNDTPSFGPDDGELTGQALLDGTYTVGMYFGWNWTEGSNSGRVTDDATMDVAFGATGTVTARAVVGQDNCNQCHQELQFHGGLRKATTLCLLCHTAGSEDRNVAGVPADDPGTPGRTVEFSIMIHKIHNGGHQPSVLGVTTDTNGDRDYTATPRDYQLVGFGDNVHNYSDVEFPAWPNLVAPMPRDSGYAAVSHAGQGLEDQRRRGMTGCNLCHGDPDGSGPIQPPADGDLVYTQMKRKTCGSCHDDWVWTNPYTANMSTMPQQLNDNTCVQCHPETGSILATRDSHLHPMMDPLVATGVVFDLTSVAEAGSNDGDGTLDPGEKIELTFTVQDSAGADVDASTLNSRSIVIAGPTDNSNVLIDASLPAGLLAGAQPYTIMAPQIVYFEDLGPATAGTDVFTTDLAPHWDPVGADTEVWERGADGSSTTLAAGLTAPVNFIDVASSTGFARDDYIVINDGGLAQEILQVQWVDGDRLWFSSPHTSGYAPGPVLSHIAGESVTQINLTLLTDSSEYSLLALTGTITETGGFTTGSNIITSYTTDYIVPNEYGLAINEDPTLGEPWGSWAGKSLEDGTYTASVWGYANRTLNLVGETNTYQDTSHAGALDFLVGDATTAEPYGFIDGPEGCYRCHVDIQFHGGNGGGRRGWDTCLACHGTSGAADRPRYVAENAPDTDETSIGFRQMLHKIHMGSDLANADTYTVVGFGPAFLYPDNYSEHTYEDVHFPAMPAGVKDCVVCHGANNTAWQEPSVREHSAEQDVPIRAWLDACSSCHDSSAQRAHMDANTSPSSGESCAVCHGVGKEQGVPVSHFIR